MRGGARGPHSCSQASPSTDREKANNLLREDALRVAAHLCARGPGTVHRQNRCLCRCRPGALAPAPERPIGPPSSARLVPDRILHAAPGSNLHGIFAKLFGPAEPKVWPVHVDDDNFATEVRRSAVPVLLDVWGPSCAPCKQMEPIIFRVAKQYQGRVKIAERGIASRLTSAQPPHRRRFMLV